MQQRYERIQELDVYQKTILRIRRFLELSIGKDSLLAVYIYIVGLTTTFILVFIALLLNGYSLIMALLFPTFIVGSIYYLFVLMGYRNKVLITHEGLVMVQELLDNYKIYNRSIYEAIERTADTLAIEQAPLSKKMLKNLSYRLRQARNDTVVKQALNQMFYVMDVSWAYSLAVVIEKAVIVGLDIEDSLKDIFHDLEELERLKQDLKEEIHESKVMLMYVAPAMFALTFYIVTELFGFSLGQFLNYQFGEGLMYFLMIVILYIFAFGFYLYVTKPKNDF